MSASGNEMLIRRLTVAALLLCCFVVVFGGYVRLSAAGLGCPDWPGCYGHFTPMGAEQSAASQAAYSHVPLNVGKAWREMVHRYAASTLGLIIAVIAALTIASRRQRIMSTAYALALLAIVVLQGVLGMLTVTWSLKPLIVTLHLMFGLTTLGLLWWLWLSMRERGLRSPSRLLAAGPRTSAWGNTVTHRLALIGLLTLGVQIALGGWTSSNYAAVACPDLPTCQGRWWPETDFRDAFVLWRGLGINYEGGVLEHPARVAIHLTHRIGAIVTTFVLAFAAIATLRRRGARAAAIAVLAALALQLTIGVVMVLNAFPLPIAAAHNAGAALLLLATLALYRQNALSG
jgi:cytochrome c oxidase assembly protein subunit 15